jgi:hypothetical protein
VEAVNALGNVALGRVNLQLVRDMNTPDDEHAIFLSNFTYSFGSKMTFACRNAARRQRAP